MNQVGTRYKNAGMAAGVVGFALITIGCNTNTIDLFNPAFISTTSGGYVPLTPGPEADFVMVRCLNETGQNATFIVAIEREIVVERDVETGAVTVETELESVQLRTGAQSPANELGALFPCSESAINRVGLGRNLSPTDTAVIVGGGTVGQASGIGISAATLNPLNRVPAQGPSNFNCGDTVIFRAITDNSVSGRVRLESFLLPGFEQPSEFAGPNTFVNYQNFLESQVVEEQP
jgi:hypothetical protein